MKLDVWKSFAQSKLRSNFMDKYSEAESKRITDWNLLAIEANMEPRPQASSITQNMIKNVLYYTPTKQLSGSILTHTCVVQINPYMCIFVLICLLFRPS